MFAVPREQVVRIHASSGTTGKPTVVGYTRKDIDTWADLVARSIRASGGRAGDIVHIAYGYGLFTGGLGAHYGAERLGCTVIPMSGGQTEKQVQLIQDFRPDHHHGDPVLHAGADRRDGQAGHRPGRSCSLDVGIFGAEPWTEAMRAAIEQRAGLDAVDIYGLSEVMGPGVANECIETKDGPVIWEDHFYPEIIDPQTGQVLPDGEPGELVFTSLTKEALPVIRYRTRDLTRLLPPTARSMRRIDKITGRSDDMLIIRGVNVFPSQIEELICKMPALAPHYLLVVGQGRSPRLAHGARRAERRRCATPTATPSRGELAAPHQELHRRVQPRSRWSTPTRSSALRSARPGASSTAGQGLTDEPQGLTRGASSHACTRKPSTVRNPSRQTSRKRGSSSRCRAKRDRLPGRVRCQARTRRVHRAEGLDARGVPQDAGAADLAARALRDRRHAAGGQLDHPRADAEAQGHPARQGAGRGRPRPLSVRGRRDPRRVARRADRGAARRQGQVLVDLQLPDADLGRHRRHRLAGRRRGDHEPDPAAPLLVRPLRARHDPHLQGRELPSAPGLRPAADDDARHARRSATWSRTRSTAGGGRR